MGEICSMTIGRAQNDLLNYEQIALKNEQLCPDFKDLLTTFRGVFRGSSFMREWGTAQNALISFEYH